MTIDELLFAFKKAEWKPIEEEGVEDWEYTFMENFCILRYRPYMSYHFFKTSDPKEAWEMYLDL